MALLWADGFDHYGTDNTMLTQMGYSFFSNGTIGGNTVARTGTGCVRWTNYNFSGLGRNLDAAITTCITSFAINPVSAVASNNMGVRFLISGATVTLCRVVIGTLNQVQVYNGAALVGQTANNVVPTGTYTSIQVKVIRSATVGSIEVRVNGGTSVGGVTLTVSGLNLGTIDIDSLQLGSQVSDGTGGCNFYFDDWIICDNAGTTCNDFLGDRRCDTGYPNADTATMQWTPSTGTTGFNRVNTTPAVDTSYLEAGTVGNIAEFARPPIGISTTDIAAVMVVARVTKTDAGTATIRLGVHSGATVLNGPSIVPGVTTYAYVRQPFEVDPNGSIPWTKASVDAMTTRITRDS